eukprot:TRINITY_DN14434_c0_g1_i1.p1 TRINITY_DN14434_c0_g1~~TRINITY_DN14434_c0_g1_i1.p1  ORF type:complete len:272 (-),score=73.53 TRINITY_DN14434_c0_g1_i1:97-912(-)
MTTIQELDAYLELAVRAAKVAGGFIREAFSNSEKKIEFKGEVDLVTETDKKCEDAIHEIIFGQYPTHSFIGEETTPPEKHVSGLLTDAPTWIVDPVDGTTNFSHSYPFVAVSIALAINREIVVGVVYNPIMEELFTAKKGQGAYLNGKQIFVSKATEPIRSLVATGFPYDRKTRMPLVMGYLEAILTNTQCIRRSGSAALDLCSVACGRVDIYYEFGPKIWDVAAGVLCVLEAGGIGKDVSGEPLDILSQRIITGNEALVDKIVSIFPKSL